MSVIACRLLALISRAIPTSANGGGSTGATVGRPTLSRAVADAATSGTRSANTAFAAGTAAAAANSSGVELRAHGIALLLGSAIMFFYL